MRSNVCLVNINEHSTFNPQTIPFLNSIKLLARIPKARAHAEPHVSLKTKTIYKAYTDHKVLYVLYAAVPSNDYHSMILKNEDWIYHITKQKYFFKSPG